MGDFALGRVLQHDERSREFPARRAAAIRSVSFLREVPAFDQGDVGSCTGNAAAGTLMTAPFFQSVYAKAKRKFSEADALSLYKAATRLDGFKGVYPPDDTGSSGLAVAKAAKKAGFISGYHHAFGLEHALQALSLKPCIAGVPWYNSFFEPNRRTGLCDLVESSGVAGGHEIQLIGIDLARKTIEFVNSWGPSWGRAGRARFTFETFGRLLSENGDVTVFDA